MDNEKNKKKIVIISLTVATLLIVALGVTYAYWILTRQQTGENVVNTACLNITFTGEHDISLDKAYPMNEKQLENFLSTATPYHFTIHNECNDLASASINLESLTVSGKALEDEYIDAILYEDDYNTNLNTNKKLTGNTSNDANKVISDAKHAYSLYNFTLKANEERDFNLLLYMDPDTPMEDANMNASWKGKITLSTEYQEENTTIRKIDTSVNKGMWEYKDKLTKIVIENKKSVKTAEDDGKVYGPFDESADGYGGVQSYVVCDTEETDCTGYLQGTNGIKGNEDSSYLFVNFKNVTNIEGLENLNTSNVTNMTAMFMSMTNLQELDLSMWDTSNLANMSVLIMNDTNLQKINISNWDLKDVTCSQWYWGANNLDTVDMSNVIFPENCSYFFAGGPGFKAKKLILENVDTSHVTNMNGMFNGASNIQELDLSSFDTTNVTNINDIFKGMTNLQTLNLSNWVLNDNMTDGFSARLGIIGGGCKLLENLILENVNTSKVTTMSSMFPSLNSNNNKITKLDLSSFNTSNVTDMNTMFGSSSNLQEIDLSSFDTGQVTNMSGMFYSCTSLQELDLSSFDTSNVTNMNTMFIGTVNMKSITFGPNFVHKPEATTSQMFGGCASQDRPTGDTWIGVSFD